MIKVKCPSCQAVVSGPERLCGKNVQCGQCKTVFVFPQSPAPAAAQTPRPQATPRPVAPRPAPPQAVERQAPQPDEEAPERKGRKTGVSKNVKKYAMMGLIAVMLLALAAAGFFVISKLRGGSSPNIIAMYASNETFVVGRIDIRSVMGSDLYKKLGLAEAVKELLKEIPTKLAPEDFSSITFMADKPYSENVSPTPPMVVVNVKKDMPLKDMLDAKLGAMIEKVDGLDYVAMSSQAVLAKTDAGTVCVIPVGGVGALRKLAGELRAGQKAKLNDDLTAAMALVSDQDNFFAAYVPQSLKGRLPAGLPIPASVKSIAVGFSMDSDLVLKIAATFPKEKEASDLVMSLGMLQALGTGAIQGQASGSKDPDTKAVFTAAAKVLSGIEISNKGPVLLADAKISGSDIVMIKEKFAKVAGAMMGAAAAPAGGQPTTAPSAGGNPLDALMGIFGK